MPSLSRLSDIAAVLDVELRDLLPAGKPSAKQHALTELNTLAKDLSADQVETVVRVVQALYELPGVSRSPRRRRRKRT